MSRRTPAFVVSALLCCASAGARAQSVDEMIEQLKGQPGSEQAIRELEAHRAEIEAAQRAARAQAPRAGAQAGTKPLDIVPLHSFEDLPQLPENAQAARKRYGHLPAPEGRKGPNGDVETAKVLSRVQEWTDALSRRALAQGMPSGSIQPQQGRAVGELSDAWTKQRQAVPEAQQSYRREQSRLQAAFREQAREIQNQFGLQYTRCMDRETHAGGSTSRCAAIRREENSKVAAVGTGYLKALSGPYGAFRARMKQIAAEGQAALDKANRSFPSGPPGMATVPYQGILTGEIEALASVASADSDAVVLVSEQFVKED